MQLRALLNVYWTTQSISKTPNQSCRTRFALGVTNATCKANIILSIVVRKIGHYTFTMLQSLLLTAWVFIWNLNHA